jgi:mannose/cellobiose epimerase-like protein (N-acyl-D-glucosamine 2-epimerase family)
MPYSIKKICNDFSTITLEVLDAVIDRCCKDANYPFIDTKINIITGEDIYPPAPGEDYNAKNIIFSWIQGRGMEALAGHAEWLKENASDISDCQTRIDKIHYILKRLVAKMEECRARNKGKMFFIMDENGQFLNIGEKGKLSPAENINPKANFSDLFYSKGLLAAAAFLNDPKLLNEAERYFEDVVNDIRTGNFATDQQSFDPKNQVAFVEGKFLQGPCMICLDGVSMAALYCNRSKWLDIAHEMIEHIFSKHINTGQFTDLEKYDFWEAVNITGQPWDDDGKLLCDPGHTLEFVGLSLKCILQMRDEDSARTAIFLNKCREHLPPLMKHCFSIGYAAEAKGIIKAFDLRERVAMNTDMPWWSLPETIRAAAEIYEFTNDKEALDILKTCSEAFLNNYINPNVHSMAYQTRNENGEVINVVPATPDADPGYHTGLSLIDAIRILKKYQDL